MELRAPSENEVFSCFSTLISAINEHAAKEEYVVATKHSKKSQKTGFRKVWLRYGGID